MKLAFGVTRGAELAVAEIVYVLHLGVEPVNLAPVRRALEAVPAVAVNVDGDGWNSWGERVGTDVNDRVTLHVTATLEGTEQGVRAQARDVVARLDGHGHLVTSTEGLRTVAVLTTDADYNVDEAGGVVWSRTGGACVERIVSPPGAVTGAMSLPLGHEHHMASPAAVEGPGL